MIDYVKTWSEKSELPATRLVAWLRLERSKFYDWRGRYGKINEHNSNVPPAITDSKTGKKKTIVRFGREHPQEDGWGQTLKRTTQTTGFA